jgi:hypothetical protein
MRCSTGLVVRAFVGRFVGAAEVRLIGLGVKEVGAGVELVRQTVAPWDLWDPKGPVGMGQVSSVGPLLMARLKGQSSAEDAASRAIVRELL